MIIPFLLSPTPAGTVSQLGVTIGLLLSQILGLPLILGTDEGWPFLLGVAFIPAVLQLLLLPLCPESPRYLLISKGRAMEATYGESLIETPSFSLTIIIFLKTPSPDSIAKVTLQYER